MGEYEQPVSMLYLVRHGNTANQGLIYNLDQYAEEKPVEIDKQGKEQMRTIANMIADRGARITHLCSSDQRRAIQSLDIIIEQLRLRGSIVSHATEIHLAQLRDVDAAATMAIAKSRGGITMEELKKATGGNIYEGAFSRFEDTTTGKVYKNESLEAMRQRMLVALGRVLKAGHPLQAVIVSHGDPLRTLVYGLENPSQPLLPSHYSSLTQQGYLEKGEASEIILDLEGKLVTSSRLPDPQSIGKRENF